MLLSTQTDITARKLGYEGAIRLLAKAGYDLLDFSFFQAQEEGFFDLDEADILSFAREMRSAAESCGVAFDQTHPPFSFPGEMWKDWEKLIVPVVVKSLRASAALGAKVAVVHPVQYLNYQRNAGELYELNIKYYNVLRPYAEELGIRIALENMWQFRIDSSIIVPSVCASPKEFCSMLDDLGSDVFTACLDIGHCPLTGWTPAEAIRALGHDRLGALHVHDNDKAGDLHILPGFGKIDWNDVCKALGEIDYAGVFTYECDNFFNFVLDDSLLLPAAEFCAKTGRHLVSMVDANRPAK